MLARAVRPVDGQGQIDGALARGEMPPETGEIDLLRQALLELQAKHALGVPGHRKDHDAGGVEVEPVHQQRLWVDALEAGDHAVGKMLALAGDGQKPGRLVHQHDLIVGMDDADGLVGRGVDERGGIVLHGGCRSQTATSSAFCAPTPKTRL